VSTGSTGRLTLRGRKGKGPRRGRFNLTLALFLLPALFVYGLFLAVPAIAALAMSVTDWRGPAGGDPSFVGLRNFTRLATDDPIFSRAFGNNVKFTLTVLVAQTLLSLLLALMLVKNTRINVFYRVLFFVPTIISSVSVALAWVLMYDSEIGALNAVLEGVGLPGYSWLGNRGTAIFSLAFVQFWQHTGQVMIIFVAGLQAIPRELYEAAELEGATRWQNFRHITLPLLAPAAAIVVAYTTIQSFRAFDLVIALTDGGPANATEILSTWIYHNAFLNNTYGYASAGAVIFMIILGALTALQFRLLRVDR